MQTIKATVKDTSGKFSQDFTFEQYFSVETDSDGNETKTVDQTHVVELSEALAKGGDDAIELVKACNYGLNLKARATARAQANAKAEGPDKAIAKAVAGLVALGWSEDEALGAAKAKLGA